MEAQHQNLAHPKLPREFWEALFEIYQHYTPREMEMAEFNPGLTFAPIWQNLMCLQDYLDVALEEGWLD